MATWGHCRMFCALGRCIYGGSGESLSQSDYPTGCILMIQAFTAVYLLWMTDPARDFRHERDYAAPEELSFLRRVYWALCIMNNPRGVGWTCQVANVPPLPTEARWPFVRRRLRRAIYWYMLLDIFQNYEQRNPLFSLRGEDVSVSSQGYLLRPVNIFVRVASVAGSIAMQHALLAAAMVAFDLSLPRDWPDIYGRWSDAYTVRRLWGRSYHQSLRRLTASTGKMVCRMLDLRPGSWASSYTQLYIGFAVSGLIHCGGDFTVSRKLFGSSFLFFFSQAIAITVEDVVIGAARRARLRLPNGLARLVGFAWVFIWMNISCPWYIDWSLKEGVMDTDRVPFSLINLMSSSTNAGTVLFYAILSPMKS
ncbi:membrane bound O-acyl transferase family-domain-containing protein [Fomitopsis serialis]|uniref:membrane bound O-acyl transferase family-domain-containing protein n=1 Tax=Fomitopsis serialis TaxID=139415 RepID=UPI0020078F84|nr:membrane bound O-acyl transferase family-domain-containing protein [Neoantrodia serialis]KAH9922491.1 membrane bound O-acyl transferase family-domain-containing protein [Neoantrodia serialis]